MVLGVPILKQFRVEAENATQPTYINIDIDDATLTYEVVYM